MQRLKRALNAFIKKNLGDFVGNASNEGKGRARDKRTTGRFRMGEKSRFGLVERFRDLLVGKPIPQEDLAEMGELIMEVILVAYAISSQGQGFEDAQFLARVVVRESMKITISVG